MTEVRIVVLSAFAIPITCIFCLMIISKTTTLLEILSMLKKFTSRITVRKRTWSLLQNSICKVARWSAEFFIPVETRIFFLYPSSVIMMSISLVFTFMDTVGLEKQLELFAMIDLASIDY